MNTRTFYYASIPVEYQAQDINFLVLEQDPCGGVGWFLYLHTSLEEGCVGDIWRESKSDAEQTALATWGVTLDILNGCNTAAEEVSFERDFGGREIAEGLLEGWWIPRVIGGALLTGMGSNQNITRQLSSELPGVAVRGNRGSAPSNESSGFMFVKLWTPRRLGSKTVAFGFKRTYTTFEAGPGFMMTVSH